MGNMPKNIYTVGQLNSYIRNMFEQDYMLTSVYVQGEISNLKYHSSGHIYFTLKDEKGTIACVMFSKDRGGLGFRMEEGMQIIAGGNVDVYERDGKYQLYARQIMLSGNGQLSERFERLKKELEERGMFASEYKVPIPKYIHTLGVVTAPTGAAVQDIINIATRRNPYIQIILYPAIVQGDNAAASIIKGIQTLEKSAAEVIIVGRGGGSIEDLWAFNEEAVAQAVFDCTKPVISAVGHETDTTICDYVADLRAPTPSAAAELAVFDQNAFLSQLEAVKSRMNQHMKHELDMCKSRNQTFRLKFSNMSPENQMRQKRMYLLQLEDRFQSYMEKKIKSDQHKLAIYAGRMEAVSPLNKLSSGYGYISKKDGSNIHDIQDVQIQDEIMVTIRNGEIMATVTDKKSRRTENE